MNNELKEKDWVNIEGYDKAWIGWVTKSSYLINKIKSIRDEKGEISYGWLLKSLEVEWVLKSEWHSKNRNI